MELITGLEPVTSYLPSKCRGGAAEERRGFGCNTGARAACFRRGDRKGSNVGSGSSRGCAIGGREVLVGAYGGDTVPEPAGIHVLRGAHRQGLLLFTPPEVASTGPGF